MSWTRIDGVTSSQSEFWIRFCEMKYFLPYWWSRKVIARSEMAISDLQMWMRTPKLKHDAFDRVDAMPPWELLRSLGWERAWYRKQPTASPATPYGGQGIKYKQSRNRIWPQIAVVPMKGMNSVRPEASIFHSPPGSSIHGIFQARTLEWVAISFPRASSQPRDRSLVSHTTGRLFTIWATREALPITRRTPSSLTWYQVFLT